MSGTGSTNGGAPDPAKHAIDPREFIGIRAGYADLLGGETTWKDLENDLSHYTLAEVLDVLGRISALLKTARHDDPEIQRSAAK